MKKNKIWKKVLSHILTGAMVVSLFAGVDMGWNVMEVQAAEPRTVEVKDLKTNDTLSKGDIIHLEEFTVPFGVNYKETQKINKCLLSWDSNATSFKTLTTSDKDYKLTKCVKLNQVELNAMYYRVEVWMTEQHDFTQKDTSSTYLKQAATCTTNAQYYYKCAGCDAKGTTYYTLDNSALGHNWSDNNGICKNDSEHTCDHAGYTDASLCGICGKTLHTHGNFSYVADANKITATCQNANCTDPAANKSITINRAGGSYTGSAYEATLDGTTEFNELTGKSVSIADIKYYKGDDELTEAPKNAGAYKAKITVEGATATANFDIAKKNIADADLNITRDDAVYDGISKPAAVMSKSSMDGMGSITVKYEKKNGESWETPTEEAPVNAGTYRVTAYVAGGDNFNPSNAEVKTFTISKATPTIETVPTFNHTITYGTILNDISLDTGGVAKLGDIVVPGTFAWKNGATKPVVSDSEGTDSTSFLIVFTPTVSENFNTCETSVTLTVNPASPSAPEDGVGYTINYVAETLAPSSEDFEIGMKEGEDINSIAGSSVTLSPGITPQTDIYYVRYKANANQSASDWTAITIPARPAAPNAVGKQETIMSKGDAEVTGVNTTMEYKVFDDLTGWSGWSDVTGINIPNAGNKKIAIRVKASNDNKNFYGEEQEIEFTASTTKLKVSMGNTVVWVPYNGIVLASEKPTTNPTPPVADQLFMYWSLDGEEWIFGATADDATANKVTENITLVPVFGKYFQGEITALSYDKIKKVSLVDSKGNRYEDDGPFALDGGKCTYRVLAPVGVDYNLVIEGEKGISGTKHDITKTQLIRQDEEGSGNATMPAGVFNSKVTKDSAGDFEHTLVGGLDEIADAHENSADVVTVELTVKEVTSDTAETNAIDTVANGKELVFVELTLTKTTNGVSADIGNANDQLLEIIVPYDTTAKYSIAVYRYHGTSVDTISTTANADGEYIEIGTDTITIHAKKFSTYAIGYSTTPPSSGSKTPDKSHDDDSNDSGSTPTEPKKEAPVEKKPQATTPKKIVKDTTPKSEDKEEIKNELPSSDTSAVKDNDKDNDVIEDEDAPIRIFSEEKEPSKEAKDAIEKFIEKGKIPFDTEGGKPVEVGMHFGKTISIKAVKTLANGEEVEVTDWDGKMTVTVDIPKDLIKDGRNYYVIAYVNGEAKRINVTVNADNTITFDAEEGAEYAICYIDDSEIPSGVMDKHNGKHNLLWLYLVLLIIFAVARVITKDKTNPVKIALVACDAVVAGLLLIVVKVCLLSVIVCLAEIAVAVAIHFVIKNKESVTE